MPSIHRSVLLTALLAALCAPGAEGQQEGPPAAGARVAGAPDRVYEGRDGELTVPAPRVTSPEVSIDGRLDEEVWERAAVLRGFTQYEPSEGIPATNDTEVYVLVSDEAIYFGIRAHDSEPGGVRATLSERDSFTRSDDYVRIILDTFDDQRRAYAFTVNPLGVQHDGLWLEGGGDRRGFGPPIDDNPDFVWRSDGELREWGWSAEIEIPFKSIRFPEVPVQDWGINVFRNVQRLGFQNAWAPVTEDVSNRLSQSGTLSRLESLDPGMFLEINPVTTGRWIGQLVDETDSFERDDPEADFGMNVTYGLTSNLTLDGTYNPDFSQVEADAGQIAVNERFALFFDEKRPFFLEGTEIFSLPKRLIYTRTIVDPIGGAKITGKVGSLNVGYLGAVDEAVDDGGTNAKVNFFRARQDLGASSTLGLLYTDRTRTGDDFNRVAGADARLVLGSRYTLEVLGASSWDRSPEEAEAVQGGYVSARFERAGRGLSFSAELEDHAPEFVAGSGFLRRRGDAQLRGQVEYNRFGEPGALLESWGGSAQLQGFWDHDDLWDGRAPKEREAELGLRLSFRNNIFTGLSYFRTAFDSELAEYDGLRVRTPAGSAAPFRPDQGLFSGLDGFRLFTFISRWQAVRGNLRLEWREVPVFERRSGVPVEPGDALSANMGLNLFPTPQLQAEVGLRHERITRARDGSEYSTATIPRVRLQYQFSRALFFRTILEYAAQEQGALLDPVTGNAVLRCDDETCEPLTGTVERDVHVEGLLSYEPTPGTVFFLGYSRDMIDEEAFGFRDLQTRADGLFVKASYRFRF